MSRKIKIKKTQYIMVCPRCGSIDVQTDFSNPVVWASGASTTYKCNNCNHMSSMFPEVLLNEISEFRKKLRKEKNIVTESQKEELIEAKTGFYVGIWEIVFLLVTSALSIFYLIYDYKTGSFDAMSFLIFAVWIIVLVFVLLKAIKGLKKN